MFLIIKYNFKILYKQNQTLIRRDKETKVDVFYNLDRNNNHEMNSKLNKLKKGIKMYSNFNYLY